jgi:hypothetical protein
MPSPGVGHILFRQTSKNISRSPISIGSFPATSGAAAEPVERNTDALLELLARHHAHATFFTGAGSPSASRRFCAGSQQGDMRSHRTGGGTGG